MLPHFERDADGGLTLYIQHKSPGKAKESNWLPAPKGPMIVFMRLYWPKTEAVEGKWIQPTNAKKIDEMKKLHSFKLFVTLVAALVISSLPLCAQTKITPDEARAIARDRRHLGLPRGGQLPRPIRLFRGSRQPRVQVALERDSQHHSRLHAG